MSRQPRDLSELFASRCDWPGCTQESMTIIVKGNDVTAWCRDHTPPPLDR